MLRDGKLNAYWIACNNNCRRLPTPTSETYQATAAPRTSSPSRTLSHRDGVGGRPDPADRHVGGEGREPTATPSGGRISGTSSWARPAGARSDLWQLAEFSKRFTTDEVWRPSFWTSRPSIGAGPSTRCCSGTGRWISPADPARPGIREPRSQAFRLLHPEGLFEEYAGFGRGHCADLAPLTPTIRSAACWPRW